MKENLKSQLQPQLQPQLQLKEIKKVIDEFGISMPKLAEKLGISDSSFKKKIEPEKYAGYSFSKNELESLENVVLELVGKLKILV